MRKTNSTLFIIQYPKTKEEFFILGAYVPIILISYLAYANIIASFINSLKFNDSLTMLFDYFPLLLFSYLLNKTIGIYYQFPLIIFSQKKIKGISMKMGIPLFFSVMYNEVIDITETPVQHMPSFWTINLKWTNKKRLIQYAWMGKQITVTPFLKGYQKLILEIEARKLVK